MWGFSVNFIALLFGAGAVIALFISATDADTRIAKANARAAELADEAEKLKAKNLAFEAAISPRTLEQTLTAQKLSSFSDIHARVVSPSDFEPRRTAGQINFVMSAAKWKKFTGTITIPLPFLDGVSVHAWIGPLQGVPDAASRQGAIRSGEAAKALVDVLNEAGVESKLGFPIPELGPNAVLVEVGPKPLPATLQLKPENIPAGSSVNKTWGNIENE